MSANAYISEIRNFLDRLEKTQMDAIPKRVMPANPLKDVLAVSKGCAAKPW